MNNRHDDDIPKWATPAAVVGIMALIIAAIILLEGI